MKHTPTQRAASHEVFPKTPPLTTLRFDGAGAFKAYYAACDWCKTHGYSVGTMQGPAPIGLLKGDFDIAKWRNLDRAEKLMLDGTIEGAKREGPVFVHLRAQILGEKVEASRE